MSDATGGEKNTKIALKLTIRGLVHGVLFRVSMREYARSRGVNGWVRNKGDGSVEALIEGEEQDVLAVLAWAGRGPPMARVKSVQSQKSEVKNFRGFMVIG